MIGREKTGKRSFKLEAQNPCLRRSGFAQAGEVRNKSKLPKRQIEKEIKV